MFQYFIYYFIIQINILDLNFLILQFFTPSINIPFINTQNYFIIIHSLTLAIHIFILFITFIYDVVILNFMKILSALNFTYLFINLINLFIFTYLYLLT